MFELTVDILDLLSYKALSSCVIYYITPFLTIFLPFLNYLSLIRASSSLS